MATVWTSSAAVTHPKKPGSVTVATYWGTPIRTAASPTASAHPKLPGSAPAVQFGPSQKAVTGLKSKWGKKRKKTAGPWALGTGSPLPAKATCSCEASQGADYRRPIVALKRKEKQQAPQPGADRRSPKSRGAPRRPFWSHEKEMEAGHSQKTVVTGQP